MDLFSMPEYKRYAADRIRLTASESIPLRAAMSRGTVEQHEDIFSQSIILQFRTWIHGMTKERVTVHETWPSDWWQAFKERWFPQWALRRWPVKHERIDIDQPIYLAVCPHIEDTKQGTHLEWMATQWDRSLVKPKENA